MMPGKIVKDLQFQNGKPCGEQQGYQNADESN
jgi:hypothetical protein